MINRAHDEEDDGEEADGVDAEGEGGDGFAGAAREADGLPRVEEIARDEGDGDAGEDAADDEFVGRPAIFGVRPTTTMSWQRLSTKRPKKPSMSLATNQPGRGAAAGSVGSITSP